MQANAHSSTSAAPAVAAAAPPPPPPVNACTPAERARVAAASAAERAACEARYAAACAAAAAAGAPAPFRGPAADAPLGERFLDIISVVSASGFALDARPARFLCGLTFRLGARRADGTIDRAGFLGGTADMIHCALRLQAPWLDEMRRMPRELARMRWGRDSSSVDRTSSLMRAADACDERRVRELLAAGAPLRCVNKLIRTALHHACLQGDARVVAALLEADAAGATVDARDFGGFTSLSLAGAAGHEGAARALLARGARHGLRDEMGMNALHWAAHNGRAGVVEQLCAAPGAQVDAVDDAGFTALVHASTYGREGAARALLARGARQDLRDRGSLTALHHAAIGGHARIVELLCAAPDAMVDAKDVNGRTPLMVAGEGAVQALLACGARLDARCRGQMTALHWAANDCRAAVVTLLCAAPGAAAALALRDGKGRTPLDVADERRHGATSVAMRAGIASLQAEVERMRVAAAMAAERARAAAAMAAERARVAAASAVERAECEARFAAASAAAAAAGAPAPFRGPAADSPLGERFLDVVALVSANGFALDARPARFVCGLTFRLGARRADGGVDRAGFLGGPADMIDRALRLQAPWLEAARRAPRERFEMQGLGWVERTTSLMRAAHQGNEHRVRLLLAAGAPLRCVDDSWRMTALHNASAQGSARAVAAMLEADAAGATVNAQDKYGRTALVLASVNGHEGAVRALLAGGARQGLLGNAGRTALHLAAANGHTGVVRLLCAAPGAPVDSQDSDGSSPLLLASWNGSEDAVRILLARGAQQGPRDSGGMAALHQAASYGYAGIVELLCAAPGAAAALALRDGKGRTPLAAASGAACAAVLRAHGAS